MASQLRETSPGALVGIDEALIAAVVDTFYDRVRADPMIGPIFDAAVRDWPAHLARLRAFWSSILLMTGEYKGQPLQAHFHLPELDDRHFLRWLDLFGETVGELCDPPQADAFLARARRIADSFRFGLAMRRGQIAEPLRLRAAGSSHEPSDVVRRHASACEAWVAQAGLRST